MLGRRSGFTRSAAANARARVGEVSSARYWEAYQRTAMPKELLGLCFVGITMAVGAGVSIFTFLPL